MRFAALVFLAAFGAVFLALGPLNASVASDAGQPHYPDLQTLTPSQLKIQRSGAQRLLRLSNTVINLGQGVLELHPVNNAATGTTDAYQWVYTHDEDGNWSVYSQTLVGTFAFHPTHNHTHFENFARYELRNVAADGSIGSTVLALSDKVSFCIIDTGLIDSSLEHSSGQTYTSCGQNVTQGLSVGWGDTYTWNLAGQSLDITGLGNGDYWLLSTADPDNLLAETNNGNNTAAVKIRIKGNSVKILP